MVGQAARGTGPRKSSRHRGSKPVYPAGVLSPRRIRRARGNRYTSGHYRDVWSRHAEHVKSLAILSRGVPESLPGSLQRCGVMSSSIRSAAIRGGRYSRNTYRESLPLPPRITLFDAHSISHTRRRRRRRRRRRCRCRCRCRWAANDAASLRLSGYYV